LGGGGGGGGGNCLIVQVRGTEMGGEKKGENITDSHRWVLLETLRERGLDRGGGKRRKTISSWNGGGGGWPKRKGIPLGRGIGKAFFQIWRIFPPKRKEKGTPREGVEIRQKGGGGGGGGWGGGGGGWGGGWGGGGGGFSKKEGGGGIRLKTGG